MLFSVDDIDTIVTLAIAASRSNNRYESELSWRMTACVVHKDAVGLKEVIERYREFLLKSRELPFQG